MLAGILLVGIGGRVQKLISRRAGCHPIKYVKILKKGLRGITDIWLSSLQRSASKEIRLCKL